MFNIQSINFYFKDITLNLFISITKFLDTSLNSVPKKSNSFILPWPWPCWALLADEAGDASYFGDCTG